MLKNIFTIGIAFGGSLTLWGCRCGSDGSLLELGGSSKSAIQTEVHVRKHKHHGHKHIHHVEVIIFQKKGSERYFLSIIRFFSHSVINLIVTFKFAVQFCKFFNCNSFVQADGIHHGEHKGKHAHHHAHAIIDKEEDVE